MVVTLDSDFGTLVIGQHEPVIGIVYLRPGHIDGQFTIDSIIIAVRRSGVDVTIRVRDLSPPGEEVEA